MVPFSGLSGHASLCQQGAPEEKICSCRRDRSGYQFRPKPSFILFCVLAALTEPIFVPRAEIPRSVEWQWMACRHVCFDCGVFKLTLTSPGSYCWSTVRLWPCNCIYSHAWSHTDHMKLTASNCLSLIWSSFLDLFQRLSLPSVFSYLRSWASHGLLLPRPAKVKKSLWLWLSKLTGKSWHGQRKIVPFLHALSSGGKDVGKPPY